jgi:beta-glucosidase
MDVQWPFGFCLSYTGFSYANLRLESPAEFGPDDVLNLSVDVTNTGTRAGKEAVLLYSSDLVASLIPDVKRLRGFEKIALQPGETKTVRFSLPASELAFVGADGRWRLEEGDFRLSCGGLGVMAHCRQTKIWNTPNI